MTRLVSPENGATVEILTKCQRDFTGGGEGAALENWLKLNRTEGDDCTIPGRVALEWESDCERDVLEISEDAEFVAARRIKCIGGRADVGNLKMGTAYYWRVNGCGANMFITEDAAPRWLHVSGMSNVRDMGAWHTQDGRRVKQGLLFRGSEMDTHHEITSEGVRVFREELGIRTDLDLRAEAVGRVAESPAGKDVLYLLMPCVAYEAFIENKQVCRELFEVLADERLYPIYFHCWGGADRTGTLALMIESVLGLSEKDIIRDYELTSLSVWGERSRNGEWFRSLMSALDGYGGAEEEIPVKAMRFLRSCGIGEDVFERLRRNMLE